MVVYFMILATILSSTLGYAFHRNMMSTVKQARESEMKTLAEETANKIERFLFERAADIQVLSDSRILTMSGVSSDVRMNYMSNVLEAYKTYDDVFVLDQNGMVTLSVGEGTFLKTYKPYLSNFLSGQPYISDFLASADGESYFIYFSSPLYNADNQLIGAVVEKMNFDSISDIIDNVKLGNTGYATLSKMVPGKPFDEQGELQYPDPAFPSMVSYTYPIKKYESQNDRWHLVIYLSKAEAYKIINDLESYFLIVVLVSLVLLTTISLIVSRNITKPIKSLKNKIGVLLEGNKKFTTNVNTSDEIKSLTSSFDILLEEMNFMLQKVLEKSGEAAYVDDIRNSMAHLLAHIPRGIIAVDSKFEIISVNQTAVDMLELKENNLIGKKLFEIENQTNNNFFDILSESLKGEHPLNNQLTFFERSDKQLVPVVVSTLRQTDMNDNLIGLTIVTEKLDEKKKFESSLERAKKLSELGELTAGVAHEIRNPLASIKGYAQYALKEMDSDNPIYPDIQIIMSEADRLDRIVERFVHFAKPDKPSYGIYKFSSLVEETIQLMEHDFNSRNISVKYDLEKNDMLPMDHEQIKQVLINLLINSAQAFKSSGEIRIMSRLMEQGNTFEIRIIDNGEGISESLMEKIFTPFFTTRDNGSGLGLSITARIVENHGGIFEIESTPGKGTCAIIKLPVHWEENR